MSRLPALLLAAGLLATLALAAAPTASAFTCTFAPSPVGGVVGRTHEYVTNVGEAVCNETGSYAVYLCGVVLGPTDPLCQFQ